MTYFQAIILGIVQGITEFFPVSSSGHLELFQIFFGFKNLKNYIFFDLICHLGTLSALCTLLFEDIKNALFQDRRIGFQILLALIPLFPLLLVMKEIKSLFDAPFLLGFTFLTTSGMLFLSSNTIRVIKNGYKGSLIIGLFQACAILPGISRSGSTIAAARFIGWPIQDAIRFSFLLAIPTIMGGVFIESLSLIKSGQPILTDTVNSVHYTLGFLFSFLVGYFALKTLMRLGTQGIVFFAWYCLLLSIFCLGYFI